MGNDCEFSESPMKTDKARSSYETKNEPSVSSVMPFYKRRKFLDEFFEHVSMLRYSNYEVIVVSNVELEMQPPGNTQVVITDKLSQGEKFDIGIQSARGEICALIGDDVYPHPDWLRNGVKYFDDPDIIAVGGPGLTPPQNSVRQHASGLVYSSLLGGGFASFRYVEKRKRVCDDLPATNLLVRRKALLQIGSINSPFRSGEDTILCLKLSKLNKKMLYAPDVVVFHHRRPLFRPHARQIFNAAVHRGYFAKRFGGNSRRIAYFLPSSGLILFSVLLLLTLFLPKTLPIALALLAIYMAGALASAFAVGKSPQMTINVWLGIILTHLAYGLGFLRGLILRDEKKLLHKD